MQKLIDNATKLNYIAATIVLRDAYEQMYGLFNHEHLGSKRPLALVARHPSEDVFTYSRSYNTIRRFIENDVGSSLNCSLTEFLQMPREYTRLVMEIITERRARKNQSAADIERKLKQELQNADRR